MKRWIVLLLAGLLLATAAVGGIAKPLHIGGGPQTLSSPSLPPAVGLLAESNAVPCVRLTAACAPDEAES
jgi:hypothetical protein